MQVCFTMCKTLCKSVLLCVKLYANLKPKERSCFAWKDCLASKITEELKKCELDFMASRFMLKN